MMLPRAGISRDENLAKRIAMYVSVIVQERAYKQYLGRYFSAAEKYTLKYLAVLCLRRKKSHGKDEAVHGLALSHV